MDTLRLISRRISPLHRSHCLRSLQCAARRGRLSVFCTSPSSAACASRKRYSIDCAFSSLRATVGGDVDPRRRWSVICVLKGFPRSDSLLTVLCLLWAACRLCGYASGRWTMSRESRARAGRWGKRAGRRKADRRRSRTQTVAIFCRKELRVCGRRQLTLSSSVSLRLVSLPLLDTIVSSKQTGWQPDDAIRI